jgi:hypothetical protein
LPADSEVGFCQSQDKDQVAIKQSWLFYAMKQKSLKSISSKILYFQARSNIKSQCFFTDENKQLYVQIIYDRAYYYWLEIFNYEMYHDSFLFFSFEQGLVSPCGKGKNEKKWCT